MKLRGEQIVRRMKQSKRKNRQFVHISGVIKDLLRQNRMQVDASLVRVWDVWEEAVGDAIGANTRPAAFKGELLIVNTTSSAWLQQLRFLKKDILARINQALGDGRVKDIKFKVGPLE